MNIVPRCAFCRVQEPNLSFSKITRSLYCSKCREKHPEHFGTPIHTAKRKPVPQQGNKICTNPLCMREFPATNKYFHQDNQKTDKLRPECKECSIKRVKNHRKRHPEYYRNYKKKNRAYFLEYARTHREYFRTASHNQRVRKKNIPGSHTAEDVQKQYKNQKGRCYYCMKKLKKGKNSYHVDHIVPISREGSSNGPDNLVIACPHCNQSKNNKLPHEWPEGGRLL